MSSTYTKLQLLLSFDIVHSLVCHINLKFSHTVINLNKDIILPFNSSKVQGVWFSFLLFIVTLRNV